jgi:hypothetical protein
LGIIERAATVWWVTFAGLVVVALAWRYLGGPTFFIEPNWWNRNYPVPRVAWSGQNFATYEPVTIEKNVGGTWTPEFPNVPLRANIWGFAEHITPPSTQTGAELGLQLGVYEYRMRGLESGKIAYNTVTVSNEFR